MIINNAIPRESNSDRRIIHDQEFNWLHEILTTVPATSASPCASIRYYLQFPKEMHRPPRRPLPVNHVISSSNNVASNTVPPNETASLEEAW